MILIIKNSWEGQDLWCWTGQNLHLKGEYWYLICLNYALLILC